MSAFESTCCRRPVCGDGSDSGAVYSSVPVLPDRAADECSMSRDVPKSDSMARGLQRTMRKVYLRAKKYYTHVSRPSSHVRSTFPGLRSRCNIDLL